MIESEKYQRLADMSKMLEENGLTAKELLEGFVNNYNKLLEFVRSLAEQKDSIFPSEAPQDARELLKEIEENK